MTMNRRLGRNLMTIAFGTALVVLGAVAAHAAPVVVATISDQVDVASYKGLSPHDFSNGNTFLGVERPAPNNVQHWGDAVQGANGAHPFDTQSIKVTRDNAANKLTIDLYTKFKGEDLGAKYADLFFDTATPAPDSFNYAIALGSQTRAAGVYANATFKTSQDIWATKSGTYGGGFQFNPSAPGYDPAFFSKSPVRNLTGAQQSEFSVVVTRLGSVGAYDLRVEITSTTNLDLFNNFDIFWGTADCSNDAIWGQVVSDTGAPAPGALALLGLGLLGIAGMNRRRTAV